MSRTITFPVHGMTCAACQARVQRALEQGPGVGSAAVNLMMATAAVTYDPVATSPQQLIDIVRVTGYDASLPVPDRGIIAEQDARDAEQVREFVVMRRKAGLSLVAGAVAMLLSIPLMSRTTPGTSVDPLMRLMMERIAPMLQRAAPALFSLSAASLTLVLLLLAIAVMAGAGMHFYRRGWNALRHGGADMNTLVAVGTLAAMLYSIAATLAPAFFIQHGIAPDVYYEAVILIIAFVLSGNALEARAKRNTAVAIRALAALQPAIARVRRDGAVVDVAVDDVAVGETVIVPPGTQVPLDGTVLLGESAVDESMLTGESFPVSKSAGSVVTGGTINGNGAFELRVTRVGEASTLAGIVRLMRDAQLSRAPAQRMADRISAVFVPAIVAIALITFGAWAVFAEDAPLLHGFAAAVAVLIIACPCAMGLAVPTAVMVATGRAAELGILIKGGEALERAGSIDVVLLDKTGTLTAGKAAVVAVHVSESSWTADDVVGLAAAVEERSQHPLAAAIVAERVRRDAMPMSASNFAAHAGLGASATVADHQVLVGNARLLAGRGCEVGAFAATAEAAALSGQTAVFVAVDGVAVAVVLIADPIRPTAIDAVARLRAAGADVALLTGDHLDVAHAIARQLGITDVIAGVLPEGKLAEVARRQQLGQRVMLVGDGVNDAPAMAQSDVGVAMGGGAGVAVEAADVALMRDDPLAVVQMIEVSRATVRVIHQNLFWAFAYNVIAIPLAAGVLYHRTGLLLSPVIASAAMALSSVTVVGNSLRLRRAA